MQTSLKSVVASGLAVLVLGACAPQQTSPDITKSNPTARRTKEPAKAKTQPPAADPATDNGSPDLVAALAAEATQHPNRLEEIRAAREAAAAQPSKANPNVIKWNDESPKTVVKPTTQQPTQPVKLAAPAPMPAAAPAFTSQPDAPVLVTPTTNMKASVVADAIMESVAKEAESGRPVAKALATAALSIRDPERAFDVASFTKLDDDERGVVTRFHEACVAIGRDLSSGKPAAEAARALAELSGSPAEEKSVLIPRIELCTKVEGFGRVTALDNRRFLPAKSTQVILYTEVDHFSCERDDKGSEWMTTLSTKVAIYAKHDGTQVWTRDWQKVVDKSQVKRDDFFICEKVVLSDFLTLGTYLMRASVRDEKTGAVAEKSIEFQIVADPALASR